MSERASIRGRGIRRSSTAWLRESERYTPADRKIDKRIGLGDLLSPYANFDSIKERFSCSSCSYTAEKYQSMISHLETEHF